MRHRSTNEFSEGHDKAYYRLAELSQDAVALQCEGDFVYMNTAGARLLGAQSPDEIIGRPVLDFVHSDSRELVKEGIELLEEKKPAGLAKQKWVRLDGRVIEVEAVAKPIDYMEHSATQFVLKGITESKRTVNRLRKSEIRTRAILDANPDLVFLVDGAGKFLDFHAGDIEQLYVPSGQIIGKNLEDVLSPEVADSASRLIKTALDSGEAQTFEYQLCLSGEPKDFEACITVSGAGEVLILARDVTGLKRMEQKIREGEERFRHVFEQSVDALLVHDDEGRMIDCNAEACRSLGYTREEFLTLSVRDFATNLVSAEGRAKGGTLWQRLMADESGIVTGVHKGEHRRKDGSTFPVEVRLGSVDYGGRRLIFGSARDITEQKSIEDALRESEERFRTLVRYGSDVITVLEVDGTIRYESPAAERVLGYQPEELTGDSVLDYVHPDDYEKLLSTFLEGVATDKPVTTAELRFRHADGAWRYMESIGVNLLNDPNVQGIIVNSRDVTARKQAEERLSKQEERLRRLIEQAADAFFVHDLQGNLIEVNGQACASLGYNREELLSMKVSDIERNLEPGGFESLWGNVLSGGPVTIEGLHWRKDGTEFPVEVRIGMFEAEEGQLMLATARDITGRKKAEEELRESEERFRTIFEQNAIGISIADPERRLLETNAAYQRITGYSGEELSGKEIADLSHPDDVPADESRNREVHAGETDRYHREKRYVRKNGEVIWVRPTISAVRDADGEPQFLIGMVEDITERKTVEATLRRQKEYLDALNEITLGLVDRLESENLLENVLTRAAGLLDTDHGFVCSLTPEGRLELRMGTGFFAGFVGDGIEADAGVAGIVLQSGEPFVVNDYPSWPNRVPSVGGQPRAMIGVPLRSGELVVGAICLAYMEEGQGFGSDEVEVLGRFAELASVALDNARLYTAAQQELAERKVLEKELAHRAFHDPLTNLPNRSLFENRLEQAIARTNRGGGQVAVLFLDLDNFKVINDSLGHETGDELLVGVGERLRKSLRPSDTAARIGGDEFVVLLDVKDGAAEASLVAERILDALRFPLLLQKRELVVNASVGIAIGGAKDHPGDLMRNADLAMYRAKARGKAQYEVFVPHMHDRALERLKLEEDLRRAIERGELRAKYQPQVRLDTGQIAGIEALVRWEHPQRGLVLPEEFIPIAEESNLIIPIGRWILREACHQASQWQAQYPSEPRLVMSVNLSARQILRPELVEEVAGILKETGLDARDLNLEITESVIMGEAQTNVEILEGLKRLGAQLAIDDFGTGYSSLSYLNRFPVDCLKIDRSFVEDLLAGYGNTTVVSSIVALAHALDMQVIAEGVETEEQLTKLRDLGCDQAQGYLFSKPLTQKRASEFLAGASGKQGNFGIA